MRFATSSFVLALGLFLGGATSLLGSWAVSAACLLFVMAAVAGAVAMEERDLAAAEERAPRQAAPATDDLPDDAALLDAA